MGLPHIEKSHTFTFVCPFLPPEHVSSMVQYLKLYTCILFIHVLCAIIGAASRLRAVTFLSPPVLVHGGLL